MPNIMFFQENVGFSAQNHVFLGKTKFFGKLDGQTQKK